MRFILIFAAAIVALVHPLYAATEIAVLKAQEGTAALLRGQFEQAITSFDVALKEQDLDTSRVAGILNDRGVANWRLARHDAALADLNKSIELNQSSAIYYNNRANVLLDTGRAEEALADLNKAVALAPAYGAAYNNRGNANFQLRRYDAAQEDYKRAIELMPTNAVPYNGRAQIQGILGRPYEGLRFVKRAIALNGKYTAAYRNRARILQHVERHKDALEDYERLIALSPEDPELYLNRGQLHLDEKKFQSAATDFTKALELEPNNAEALSGRAKAQIELRKYQDALDDLNKAIALEPKLAIAYFRRAQAFYRLDDFPAATADLNKGLELAPKYAEAFKLQAEIAEAQDKNEEAIAAYKQALAYDPFIADVAEKFKKLTGVEVPAYTTLGESLSGWEIVVPSEGRYVATNQEYPQIKALLEMHGPGEPKILEWTPLSETLRGFGLLRYSAGALPEDEINGPNQSYEFIIIVDMNRKQVVSIEPLITGPGRAKWDWSEIGVTVTDAEGLTSAYELRKPKPKAKPQPRYEDDGPWYEDRGGRSNRPRNLFDWIFR